ncbi:MAG: hypothetical protein J0H09_09055 [Burkholderiales bacterium]|nr:hypothetical protein [Burkholderiales bacterium]
MSEDEASASDGDRLGPLDREVAQCLGELIFAWRDLEAMVHDMVLHLAVYHDRAYDRDSVFHPLHVALSHMGVRDHMQIARVLSLEVKAPASFHNDLCAAFKPIEQQLIPARNRYVHDAWEVGEAGVHLVGTKPKVVADGPRKFLQTRLRTPFANTSEVRALLHRIYRAQSSLTDLENVLAAQISALDRG